MKNIIASILVLAGIALIIWAAKPLWVESGSLRAENKTISGTLSNLRSLQSKRDELLQTYNSISKNDLEKMDKIIPRTTDSAGLLVYLEKITTERGIRLRRAEFEKEPVSQQKTIQTNNLNFKVLPLAFTISSSYDSFKSFLGAIERSARVLDIMDISFNVSKTNLFEFTIKAKTYYSKEQPVITSLDVIKDIKIDTSFFADQQFLELDTPAVLPPTTGEGRINPFLPI